MLLLTLLFFIITYFFGIIGFIWFPADFMYACARLPADLRRMCAL